MIDGEPSGPAVAATQENVGGALSVTAAGPGVCSAKGWGGLGHPLQNGAPQSASNHLTGTVRPTTAYARR
jgi:hypothetical protein